MKDDLKPAHPAGIGSRRSAALPLMTDYGEGTDLDFLMG